MLAGRLDPTCALAMSDLLRLLWPRSLAVAEECAASSGVKKLPFWQFSASSIKKTYCQTVPSGLEWLTWYDREELRHMDVKPPSRACAKRLWQTQVEAAPCLQIQAPASPSNNNSFCFSCQPQMCFFASSNSETIVVPLPSFWNLPTQCWALQDGSFAPLGALWKQKDNC